MTDYALRQWIVMSLGKLGTRLWSIRVCHYLILLNDTIQLLHMEFLTVY